MPTEQDHAAGANLARDARRSPGAGWRWPGSIGAVRVAACRASCEAAVRPHRTDISCTAVALRRQGMNTNLNPDYTRVRHGQSVRRGGFALQSVSPCRCPRGRKGPATAIVLPAASGEGGEVSLRSGRGHPIPIWTPAPFAPAASPFRTPPSRAMGARKGVHQLSRPPDPAGSMPKRRMKVKYLARE